jgi:hypothetical protein
LESSRESNSSRVNERRCKKASYHVKKAKIKREHLEFWPTILFIHTVHLIPKWTVWIQATLAIKNKLKKSKEA